MTTKPILTQALSYERSTKRTHVFTAGDDPDAAVSTLYVAKDALPEGQPPERITVAISTEAPA